MYSISRTHIWFPCAHGSAPVCSRPGCSGTAVVPLCLSVTVRGLLEGGKRKGSSAQRLVKARFSPEVANPSVARERSRQGALSEGREGPRPSPDLSEALHRSFGTGWTIRLPTNPRHRRWTNHEQRAGLTGTTSTSAPRFGLTHYVLGGDQGHGCRSARPRIEGSLPQGQSPWQAEGQLRRRSLPDVVKPSTPQAQRLEADSPRPWLLLRAKRERLIQSAPFHAKQHCESLSPRYQPWYQTARS